MNKPILAENLSNATEVKTTPDNLVDFNSLNYLESIHHLKMKLEQKLPLTFAEQCVLFLITIAMRPDVATRENINSAIGDDEIWIEAKSLILSAADSFPSKDEMRGAYLYRIFEDMERRSTEAEYSSNNDNLVKTYIVRKINTSQVKIGKSRNVKGRLRTLTTQSGDKLEVLAIIPKDIENLLHKQFAELRTIGEWFDDSKGLIAAFAKKQKELSA